MKRTPVALTLLVVVLSAGSSFAAGKKRTVSPPPARMKAFVDPTTGEFRPAPAPETQPVASSESDRLSISSDGLVEEPMQSGRGVMVRLHGRFLVAVVATVEPDGSVKTSCVPAPPSVTKASGDARAVRNGGADVH
jgi:hypothetical protein